MKIKEFLPGLSIAILISLLAWFLGNLFPIIGGPVLGLFIGLLLGIILRDSQKLKAGMQFTSKKVLQYAVILLGFGLNLSQVFKVGVTSHYSSDYYYGTAYCLCRPSRVQAR